MPVVLAVGQRYRHRETGRICEVTEVGILCVRYTYGYKVAGSRRTMSSVSTFISRFRLVVSPGRA